MEHEELHDDLTGIGFMFSAGPISTSHLMGPTLAQGATSEQSASLQLSSRLELAQAQPELTWWLR